MSKTAKDPMIMKQIIFLLAAVIALLLVFGLIISRAAVAAEAPSSKNRVSDLTAQERDERDRKLREAAERRYLKDRDESRIRRETGNYALAAGVTFDGDLVVTRGAVTIAGKVNGSVLVIRGDALIDSTGEVLGDVVSVGGRIDRRPNSRVFGDMVETSPRYLIEDDETKRARVEEREPRWRRNGRRNRWQEDRNGNFKVKAHYNRVDGCFLGGELPRLYNQRLTSNIDVFGFGGYAFATKRWHFQAGSEFYIGRSFRFILGGEVHDFTDSQDKWIIPDEENSLAAFFINEDFRDYYRRDGYSLFAGQHLGRSLKISAEYRNENHLSLPNETDWSLFVNKKRFRPNPAVDEGKMVGYAGQITFDTRNHNHHPDRGWLISITGETSRPEFDGKFDFDRLIVDLRRYQPLGYGKNFDIRLRAGTGRGILPRQYLFDLGGISTLRGYRFKEFTGDRMVLANVEYRLSSGSSRLHDIPIIEEFNLILFADAGLAWFANDNTAPEKSFDSLTWSKLKTDVGLALTDRDGQVRLNFAKRTDVGGKDLVVTFRLNREF
ncbi:MAG: BamA/TamA family outer membrane protein [candidate division KSB1 bacterium]|nr:BamA/TamA family outer membrane protein [candidate division KSB1 bacterium]MDZ7368625.1 BamA/TamA family outer membrane protein [candidate division KSB1 bacterium]MDZ7406339.1 BamA/TamA family outer membrane protein [candidate division KSB1 bacterium]